MRLQRQKRARLVAAWVCLLAVAFMYAPLAGAVMLAAGADCCTGGYCKVPAHHHGKQQRQAERQAPIRHSGMTCEHESGAAAMSQCSMKCCQDTVRPVLMPVAFVLPAVSSVPAANETLWVMPMVNANEISRFVKPLSPPPRFSAEQ